MASSEFNPTLLFENNFWKNGQLLVAGVDEAGRGAWGGPVSAGAVILPAKDFILGELAGVKDSKLLTPKQREEAVIMIRRLAAAWGVGFASNVEIDSLGIVPATKLAMRRAIGQCIPVPQVLLIDAVRLVKEISLPQMSINHGDRLSLSIAAASILAKTSRDGWMKRIDAAFPGYGFSQHKGYGTQYHLDRLKQYGPCPIHRMCFLPMKSGNYAARRDRDDNIE